MLRHLNELVLLVVTASAAALLLRPFDDDAVIPPPDLAVGEVAPRTVRSPRSLQVREVETEARIRREAVERVRSVYDQKGGVGLEHKARIEAAFAAGRQPPAGDAGPRATAEDFMRSLGVYLDHEEWAIVERTAFSDGARDAAISLARTMAEQRIVEDRELLALSEPRGIVVRILTPGGDPEREEELARYPSIVGIDRARAMVDELVAAEHAHLGAARSAVALIVKRLLRPTLVENTAETARRRALAERSVQPLYAQISSGELVVEEGARVTERQLRVVAAIQDQLASLDRLHAVAASTLLILLSALIIVLVFRAARPRFLEGSRDLALVTSAYVFTLFFAWLGFHGATGLAEWLPLFGETGYRFLIPVAFGPLLLRLVLGFEVAVAFVPLMALTVGWAVEMSVGYLAYAMVGGLVALRVDLGTRPRAATLAAGLRVGVAQAVVVALLAAHENHLGVERLGDAMLALGSGLLAAGLTLVAVPIAEALLGYSTALKLSGLASLNSPLLRELLVQAPGTYHHSIVVGAMVEAGARAIGADPLLARVGGYYHDIGKLKNPGAYQENERGGSERPADPAEVLRHVEDGAALATRRRLGRPVVEIIEAHHGRAAVLRGSDSGVSYRGPRPARPEAVLVMFADAVEAAVRGEEESELAMHQEVGRVLGELVASGELDEAPLSLAELHAVAAAYVRVLRQMRARRPRSAGSVPPPMMVRPPFDPRPN